MFLWPMATTSRAKEPGPLERWFAARGSPAKGRRSNGGGGGGNTHKRPTPIPPLPHTLLPVPLQLRSLNERLLHRGQPLASTWWSKGRGWSGSRVRKLPSSSTASPRAPWTTAPTAHRPRLMGSGVPSHQKRLQLGDLGVRQRRPVGLGRLPPEGQPHQDGHGGEGEGGLLAPRLLCRERKEEPPSIHSQPIARLSRGREFRRTLQAGQGGDPSPPCQGPPTRSPPARPTHPPLPHPPPHLPHPGPPRLLPRPPSLRAEVAFEPGRCGVEITTLGTHASQW